MQNYQACIIFEDGGEGGEALREFIDQAMRDADRLKNRYPSARVVVLDINDRVVYEAARDAQ